MTNSVFGGDLTILTASKTDEIYRHCYTQTKKYDNYRFITFRSGGVDVKCNEMRHFR